MLLRTHSGTALGKGKYGLSFLILKSHNQDLSSPELVIDPNAL